MSQKPKNSGIFITDHEKKMMGKLASDIEVSMMFGEKHSEITELHSKIYDKLILLLATRRIDKEKYDKLSRLNDSRDLENMNLALTIIDKYERKENKSG